MKLMHNIFQGGSQPWEWAGLLAGQASAVGLANYALFRPIHNILLQKNNKISGLEINHAVHVAPVRRDFRVMSRTRDAV